MKHLLKKSILMYAAGLFTMTASAQLSTNPDKFLGNITTNYRVDAGGGVEAYYKLWNQITPENESKWGSVEGTRGSFNWGCDTPFNYAKQHHFTYKFHALVWGAQYPDRWFTSSLSIKDRYAAIVTWFDAVKKKYPTLPMIDVVNEAIGMHQQGNPLMKESLGGEGKTGYDWLIKAFEMAYERFPNSILIYNDYNSLNPNNGDVDNYIKLVQTLRDAGAPIDAYGNQSHDVNSIKANTLKDVMEKQHKALMMPMYITELDIDVADDNQQKKQYESIFPIMWEADYCAGVTIWGYIHGSTWVSNSGIIKNGKDRPAMTWLRDYMKKDEAKSAKSPFPGMKKRMSVFVNPLELKVAVGDPLPIKVRTFITDDYKAEKEDIAIDKVELYADNELLATMNEAPYVTEYTPTTSGKKTFKAIVYTNDGKTYERYSVVTALQTTTKREPYNGTASVVPGTIMANEYDKGASGVTYNKATRTGATQTGGWMEYSVDVKEDGLYSFDAEIASTVSGATFHLSEYSLDGLMFLTDMIEVPKTGSNTNFQTMHYALKKSLTAGKHRFCLNIDKGGFYVKSLTFHKDEKDENIDVSFSEDSPIAILSGEKATITVDASSKTSTIANVKVYVNNLLIATLTEAPYTVEYEPTEQGHYEIIAIATDANGMSSTTSYTLNVNPKREPFAKTGPFKIPGTLQAEFYDKGGESAAYHDNEAENRGDANYRTSDGVDIVNGNGGRAIGYTYKGEWVEYTVNVKETGKYSFEAVVSSGSTDSGFSIGIRKDKTVTNLADIKVPQTGNNNWDTYTKVPGSLELEAGEQILRITITGANCNIDKIIFKFDAAGISEVVADSESTDGTTYNLSGQKVNANYRGIVIQNGKKRISK